MKTSDDRGLERVLKALANRRRLAMVRYIGKQKEATVGEVAGHMKLSFKATSKHLALLAAAGILEKDQRSKLMFCRIASDIPKIARHTLALL